LPGLPELNPDDAIEREIIEHPEATNPWSAMRRIALQILYEVDNAGHPLGDVLNTRLAEVDLPRNTLNYLRQLVVTVREHQPDLDAVIQKAAPEWPLEQVAVVDRNILRIAVCEFAILTRTPIKVAIDEAVRLAKVFGAEGTARFVNGVLGTLADDPEALRQRLAVPFDVRPEQTKTGEEE
jgi:N utilization substance protein B